MTKPKKGDTLTVSDAPPPVMVAIVKPDTPDFPERATVAEDGLDHWLAQGWQVA